MAVPKLGLLAAVVGLSYVVYIPLPTGTKQTHYIQPLAQAFRLIRKLARVDELLGRGGFGPSLRTRFDNLMYVLNLAAPELDKREWRTADLDMDGVPVRMYRPLTASTDSPVPALVFIHGGGWVIGSIDAYDVVTRRLAERTRMAVISVSYRLAPEHLFPKGFEDCERVTRHVLTHGGQYGVDTARVAIVGDSAGGNLAAALTLKLTSMNNIPRLKTQVLIYPALQAIDLNTPSYQQNENHFLISHEFMAQMITLYIQGTEHRQAWLVNNSHVAQNVREAYLTTHLNHDLIEDKYKYEPYEPYEKAHSTLARNEVWEELKDVLLHNYMSPLLAHDFTGLPDTFIYTCEHDAFRDDGFLYIHRLRHAGIDVTHWHQQDGYHGIFMGAFLLDDAKEAEDKIVHYLRHKLV